MGDQGGLDVRDPDLVIGRDRNRRGLSNPSSIWPTKLLDAAALADEAKISSALRTATPTIARTISLAVTFVWLCICRGSLSLVFIDYRPLLAAFVIWCS